MAWNPSERDQSGVMFMQGMSNAGRSLGQGLAGYGQNKRALEIMAEEREEKAKDEADMGKASEMAFRVMRKYMGEELGMDEAEFKNLSAREKTATVTGLMKAQGAHEVIQRLKMNDMEMKKRSQPAPPIPAGLEPQSATRDGVTYGQPKPAAPPIPAGFEPTEVKQGGVTFKKPEEKSPWDTLKPGQKITTDDGKTMYVTNSRQLSFAPPQAKGEAPEVPNDPALYGEDDAAFNQFVQTLGGEEQRKRAVEFRKSFKSLTKEAETDPFKAMMADLLAERMGIEPPSKKGKAAAPSGGGKAAFKFDPTTGGIVPVK